MLNSNSKTKKKSRIEKYYNDVYEVYLVVANKYATLEQLKKNYSYADGVELDEEITKDSACTARCKDIKTGRPVIIVKFNETVKDAKLWFTNTTAHEATHVALDIYEMIQQNVCFCSPEPFCYLVGWATECIYKTLTK